MRLDAVSAQQSLRHDSPVLPTEAWHTTERNRFASLHRNDRAAVNPELNCLTRRDASYLREKARGQLSGEAACDTKTLGEPSSYRRTGPRFHPRASMGARWKVFGRCYFRTFKYVQQIGKSRFCEIRPQYVSTERQLLKRADFQEERKFANIVPIKDRGLRRVTYRMYHRRKGSSGYFVVFHKILFA